MRGGGVASRPEALAWYDLRMDRLRPFLWAMLALAFGVIAGFLVPVSPTSSAPALPRAPAVTARSPAVEGREESLPADREEAVDAFLSGKADGEASLDAAVDAFLSDGGGVPGEGASAESASSAGSAVVSDDPVTLLEKALARSPAPSEADLRARVETVANAKSAAAVPLLAKALAAAPELSVRAEVFRALEQIATPAAVELLVRTVRESPDDRAQALSRLARIDARDAAPALARVLDLPDASPELVAAATRALGRTRLREHLPRIAKLIAAAASPSPHETAASDGTAPSPRADANPERDPDAVVLAATEALGDIADPDGVGALEVALGSSSAAVRRAAVRSLGKIHAPAAVQALETFAASSADSREQDLARQALAGLAGEPSSPFGSAGR